MFANNLAFSIVHLSRPIFVLIRCLGNESYFYQLSIYPDQIEYVF